MRLGPLSCPLCGDPVPGLVEAVAVPVQRDAAGPPAVGVHTRVSPAVMHAHLEGCRVAQECLRTSRVRRRSVQTGLLLLAALGGLLLVLFVAGR